PITAPSSNSARSWDASSSTPPRWSTDCNSASGGGGSATAAHRGRFGTRRGFRGQLRTTPSINARFSPSREGGMRLGIVSDIHANIEALQACFDAMDADGVERTICLGDVVGYGASPNETCSLVRS